MFATAGGGATDDEARALATVWRLEEIELLPPRAESRAALPCAVSIH